MGIIIDLIFIIILAIAIYQGYKNGAVKVLLGFVVFIITIPIVYFTYKPISKIVIENTSIQPNIKTTVYSMLKSKDVESVGKIEDNDDFLPIVTNRINDLINNAKEEKYHDVIDKVSEEIATFAVQSIVAFCWSIIVYILLTLLKIVIVKTVDVIPIVSTLNYIAGSIIQVIKVLIITFVLLYLLQFILPVINSSSVRDSIDKTNIIKYVYHNNIINMCLGK